LGETSQLTVLLTHLIDNRDGNTLAKAIAGVLRGHGISDFPLPEELRMATAFFSPAGFQHVASHLDAVKQLRLMLGAEPPAESLAARRRIDESREQFEQRRLRAGLAQLEDGLRAERDQLPFARSSVAAVRALLRVLRSGKMEVRLYKDAFLHAKAYLFSAAKNSEEYPRSGLIIGSSNLTGSGLTSNLELNLGSYDDPVATQACRWFDELWELALPFDLAELYELPFAAWTPWDIFLRVLWQLYGSEVEDDRKLDKDLPLTSFQVHGVARALRLIDELGGAIVADEVGLGKTFIAGEILRRYNQKRQRALLICPAALRDSTWKRFRMKYQLFVECVSYEELANDLQLRDAQRPNANQTKLERPIGEYQLVIVDEAHNYRNPDAPHRAAALRTLLFGQRRDVLLLSATPVNNSLWDLYHLMRFFVRQDAQLADRGILSIRERFEHAMRIDPASLSPDVLYPIIDATTVKRTRQFIKKHYQSDTIPGPDGRPVPIIFPKPEAITVRYNLEDALPGFFDQLERALDPDDGGEPLRFARYNVEAYRKGVAAGDAEHEEELARAQATAGLLRSALLKRFESSAHAFHRTVGKMRREHEFFLDALGKGRIVTTAFLKEMADDEDASLEDLLRSSEHVFESTDFDTGKLRKDVQRDHDILAHLESEAAKVLAGNNPKLKALTDVLANIAERAAQDATDAVDEAQKRKVLVFCFYADTVDWIHQYLQKAVKRSESLAKYRNRVAVASGSDEIQAEMSRQDAVYGFAPTSSEAPPGRDDDLYDVLVATDVLAEGVNLQQARHIINYDVPWNPMRLVQRHGRIDRIGSPHNRVFLRTIFPVDRLDRLLRLEERILAKLAMAAASVGVMRPIADAPSGDQVFTETREEIERLLREDATLFERGGTAAAAQTGEEYRQTLRKALAENRERIVRLPWKSGSGMVKGAERGVFFCAQIDDRTYLRFLRADERWAPKTDATALISEVGTCLRLIECESSTPRALPESIAERVYDFWDVARKDIWNSWMLQTDPVNLQPKVRPLNQRVAEFIRANAPLDHDDGQLNLALDILESPWPRREEALLRGWFDVEQLAGAEKSKDLVARILETGIEPYRQAPLLPPIELDDVQLICWMAIEQT
jgi:superfamily II DNA or RNA helicase